MEYLADPCVHAITLVDLFRVCQACAEHLMGGVAKPIEGLVGRASIAASGLDPWLQHQHFI